MLNKFLYNNSFAVSVIVISVPTIIVCFIGIIEFHTLIKQIGTIKSPLIQYKQLWYLYPKYLLYELTVTFICSVILLIISFRYTIRQTILFGLKILIAAIGSLFIGLVAGNMVIPLALQLIPRTRDATFVDEYFYYGSWYVTHILIMGFQAFIVILLTAEKLTEKYDP